MSAPKTTTTRPKPLASKPTKKTPTPVKNAATPASTPATANTPDLLKKRELIENVVRRSGVKKKDAKPVIEAMLAELGETLASGRGVALPPLGRAMINREKMLDDGRVLIVKLRQKNAKIQQKPIKTETGNA